MKEEIVPIVHSSGRIDGLMIIKKYNEEKYKQLQKLMRELEVKFKAVI